ncbi:MAG TPA: PA14 domain-containing protein [Bacillota bacterium]|nr:PA14 domain-containing protein [Bacillota bacterium]
MNIRGGLYKLKSYPKIVRAVSVIVVIIALLVQTNYAVIGNFLAFVFRPSVHLHVPPLAQNQTPTVQPAAGLNAAVVNPILASQQVNSVQPLVAHEDKSRRTEHTKTIVNADGTTTKQVSLTDPLYYKKNGAWDDLKPTTTKGNNAVTLSVGDIKMTAKPLRQGIDYEYKGKKFSATLAGASNVTPKLVKQDGADTVLYENAFDGVNITYAISGYAIKEAIEVKNKTAQASFDFTYKGVTLSEDKNLPGALAIGGLPDKQLYIAPPNVSTKSRLVTEPVLSQKITGGAVRVALDAGWLGGLPNADLPVVIDPTIKTISKTPQDMLAVRSDGYRCGLGACSPTAGNEEYPSYWAYWRTLLKIPFDEINTNGLGMISSARLHLVRNGGVGSVEGYTINPAGCWDFNCAIEDDGTWAYADVGDDAWMDVRAPIQWMYWNGMTDQPLILRAAAEALEYRNIKSFDVSQMVLEITYPSDTPPPQPELVYPADKKVISDLQPILSVNPVTDPDGDPVRYVFFLMSSPNDIISTVVTSDLYWAVPDGLLKDGVTYYWSANAVYGQAPQLGPIRSFKVDLRRGKDATQSYDTIGPVSIDQATGNLSTSVSSHSLKALGGDIGVSLDYNTPAMARAGLVAEYWNNETLTGTPNLTTVTPNVNFNWDSMSPLPYQDNPSADNFSARYSGTLSVPQTGTYTFGAEYDDGVRIYVNGGLVLDAWNASGTTYGTPVTLTAGVNAQIKVEYHEVAGTAKVRLLAKSPMVPAGDIADRAWFTTGVKPLSSNSLAADYYRASDGNGTFPSSLLVSGEEASFNFSSSQGLSSKVPGGTVAPDLVRYRGFIKVPTTGTYNFMVNHQGGLRVSINNVQVINNWDKSATFSQATGVSLTAGTLIPIQIEYWDPVLQPAKIQFYVDGPGIASQILPTQWLTKQGASLPVGWQMGVDGNGSGYDYLRVNGSSVTLFDSTGSTHEYKWENNAYAPPTNEHGVLGRGIDGTHTFKDEDGKEYLFAADGTLSSMMTPTDDKRPSGLKYVYSGTPSRLIKIVDSVNTNRYAQLYYYGVNTNGNCAPPSGYDAPQTGYLCQIKTTDGVVTNLRYKSGNLVRIDGAGNQMTDFGYDSLKRIVNVRDPLANDAIAAGIRTTADGSTYDITYDAMGKAQRVVYPAATVGASRLTHTYTFLPGATVFHVSGASEPSGYSQRVEYDDAYRTTRTYGVDGKALQIQWDPAKDLVLSRTDALSLKTTTIYDAEDRPITAYGPAPAAWFGSDNQPLAAQAANVPKTESKYDEGMQGLSASYYDNKYLVRETKARTFEQGDFVRQWTSANRPVTPTTDGWGGRFTGELILPVTGDYTIKLFSDDGVRAYIDNKLVIDDWTDGDARFHPTATYTSDQAGKRVPFRIEYYDKDQNDAASRLELRIYKPGATETEALQTHSYLAPNFALLTSESVTDSTMGQITNARTYNKPEYGTLDKITLDPAGLNYASTTTTEAPGAFFRQTSKTLPGGNKTTYQYYGSGETADNPCTPAIVETAPQAGLPKGKTDPDPDGSGPLTGQKSEMIYDASGQVVAARMNSEAYTCTTYDDRGRVTQVVTPASGSRAGMTSNTSYAVGGNPLKIATTDQNGTVTTEIDLLGRTVKYTDAYGNVSSIAYDAQGRATTKTTTQLGTEVFTYDNLDRLTKYTINGIVMANVFYDAYSRVQNIDYPASNIKLVSLEYDSLLRISAANWKLSDGTTAREEQTKSTTGLITANKRTIGTSVLNQSYAYDKAGRLRSANIGTHTMSYNFDPLPSTCGATRNVNAYKNANRTSQTIDGVTTSYCYDNADRLLSSSDASYNNPVYDDRGNITQIGSNGKPLKFTYDQGNRVVRIEQQDASGNGTITEFRRDAGGRILERKQTKLTGGASSLVSQARYGYSTSGDVPDIITDTAGGLLRKVYSLPGGVTMTSNPTDSQQAKQRTYTIPSFHGDTMITTDYFGVKTGAFTYDPFGNLLDSTTPPQNNSTPNTTKGYLAQFNRLTEVDYSIPVVNMGSRVYLPGLGRFMQPDPVEGGNANAYIYPADPVNSRDEDGNFAFLVPLAFFVARIVVTAVVIWAIGKIIDKVAPPPYREPAKIAVDIISFASPTRVAAKVTTKAPVIAPKAVKAVEDIFGGTAFKSTIEFGQKQHKVFKEVMSNPDLKLFMTHSNGKRGFADAITDTDVYELKPDNPAAIKRGLKQLERYSDTTGLNGQLWVYRDKVGEFKCVYGCR